MEQVSFIRQIIKGDVTPKAFLGEVHHGVYFSAVACLHFLQGYGFKGTIAFI